MRQACLFIALLFSVRSVLAAGPEQKLAEEEWRPGLYTRAFGSAQLIEANLILREVLAVARSGFSALDADRNGRLDRADAAIHEASAPARRPGETHGDQAMSGLSGTVLGLLAEAGGMRTSITLADLEATATRLFRDADTDGDGRISPDEHAAFLVLTDTRQRAQEAEARWAGCNMARPSAEARVVVLSGGFTEVRVEPGNEPLYVVLISSRPTAKTFSGAVGRVQRVVIGIQNPGPELQRLQGPPPELAIGVASERVSLLQKGRCLRPFVRATSEEAREVLALIQRETGKEPVAAAALAVRGFRIPSGQPL